MIEFKTPGIYIKEVEVTPPARLRLDITGFVGQAERGPLHYPQPLTNWGQFQDIFGDFVGFSYLAYAVFGFFLNGGERCYIVRVAHETAKKATLELLDQKNEPAIKVEALNEGAWANATAVSVAEQSTGDLILTMLDSDIEVGQNTVTFRSVAGLAPQGDVITLIHQGNTEQLTITQVEFATNTVTFASGVNQRFPAGSSVLGKGFTLTVRYQPGGKVEHEEVFDNLSLDETHERYFVHVINGDPEEPDYVKRRRNGHSILIRVEDRCQSTSSVCARPASVEANLEQGEDGPLTLEARYYTGYENDAYFRPVPPDADEATRKVIAEKLFGLAVFEAVSDIGLIAIPDLILPDLSTYYAETPGTQMPKEGIIFETVPSALLTLEHMKTGQLAMLKHCEKMGDRFALLDAPPGAETGKGTNKIEDWPAHFQLLSSAKYGALYYPWIQEKAADFGGRELFIPPSGHLAGIYSRTERERGIGKAPANEMIQGVVALELSVSDAEQSLLNPKGVNCLRSFPGRGLRVWGARTLSLDPLWRYVNVRRVCLAIIKHILTNLQWTVFEPNDRRLWDKIVATLTLFLRDLFQSGALAGTKPEEAFFVQCNEETNPPEVIDRGEVITQIGFAPARPAEFILVTIKRTSEAISVSE
jgi:hypothetical protein